MSLLDDVSIVVTPNAYKAGELYAVIPSNGNADMDVTRATAATRVDENGLVNYAEVLGSELSPNTDFTSNITGWSSYDSGTASWNSFNGGSMQLVNDGTNSWFGRSTNNFSLETNSTYIVTAKVYLTSGYTGGDFYIYSAGTFSGGTEIIVKADKDAKEQWQDIKYTFTTASDVSGRLYFRNDSPTSSSGATVYVDNVSVKIRIRNNVPRIDYTGGGCPHILAEPQRTNLILNSEAISLTPTKNGTFVDNFAISPDGTQNATKLTATSTDPFFYQNVTFSAGQYTASLYVKGIGSSIGKDFRFAISSSTHSSNKYEIPSEWTRFDFTATISAGTASTGVEIADPAVAGDEVLVWGWQVEAGSYATSYIPTSGSAVTRNKDVFTRDGIASLINSTEGVFFVEIAALFEDGSNRSISLSDGTTSNRVVVRYIGSNVINAFCVVGGSAQASLSHAVSNITNYSKAAFKYKANDFSLWIDGVEVATDTSGTLPSANTFNSLKISGSAGANSFFGKVKQLQVYKTALTDNQLIQLTGEAGTHFFESYTEMAEALTYTIQ